MGWLHGKVAVVTGGGSGLGRAIVARFLDEGAEVVVLEFAAGKVAQLQDDFPDRLIGVQGDASTLEGNRAAVAAAIEGFGHLDVFVGNAGLWDGNFTLDSVPDDQFDETFDRVFNLNVRGMIAGARAAHAELAKTRGNMVFTLSNAALYPDGGGVWYTASKHAGLGVVRQLAFEFAPSVRVNAVAPGAFPSDLRGPENLGLAEKSLTADRVDADIAAVSPLAFSPRAEDYTGAYVMLASNENAATTTGTVLQADGGLGIRGIGRPRGSVV